MKNRKVSFQYFEYTVDKQKKFRKDGNYYTVSPVSLTWDDENYYLISYSAKYNGFTHYRVDKVNNISLSNDFIDHFGKDINISKCDEGHFIVTLKVSISPVFIGWLFQFGTMAKVLSPDSLIEQIKQQANTLLRQYQ